MIPENVFKKNPKIALKKFLKGLGYTLAVGAITFTVNFAQNVNFPPEYAIYASVVLSALQALKKGLEEYKPYIDGK